MISEADAIRITELDELKISSSWLVDHSFPGHGIVVQIGGAPIKVPEPSDDNYRIPMHELTNAQPARKTGKPSTPTMNQRLLAREGKAQSDLPPELEQEARRMQAQQSPRIGAPPLPPRIETIPLGKVRHCTACGAVGHYAGGQRCPLSATYQPPREPKAPRIHRDTKPDNVIQRETEPEAPELEVPTVANDITQDLPPVTEIERTPSSAKEAQEIAEARELAAVSAEQSSCELCDKNRGQVRAMIRAASGKAVCSTCVFEAMRMMIYDGIAADLPTLKLEIRR